jgi:hypothetical protein
LAATDMNHTTSPKLEAQDVRLEYFQPRTNTRSVWKRKPA